MFKYVNFYLNFHIVKGLGMIVKKKLFEKEVIMHFIYIFLNSGNSVREKVALFLCQPHIFFSEASVLLFLLFHIF